MVYSTKTQRGTRMSKEVETKTEEVNEIKEKHKGSDKGRLIVGLTAATLVGISIGILLGSQIDTNKTLVKAENGVVIKEEIYKQVVEDTPEVQQLLAQNVISQVLKVSYADKVDEKEVEAELTALKEMYGDSFKDALQSSGFKHEKAFKDYARTQMITQAAIKENLTITDEDRKATWEMFLPKQEVLIATFATKKEAEGYIKDPENKKFKDFENEVTVGTNVKETTLPTEVAEVVKELKEGSTSTPIKVDEQDTSTYFVVKSIKHTPKGQDITPFKEELDASIKETKMQDAEASSEALSKALKKEGLTYKDDEFKQLVEEALGI